MLPGWTCTTNFWKHNVEELSKTCKVICMDMRGHGESEKVLHSHRISRYAMDVKNLLDYLDVEDVADAVPFCTIVSPKDVTTDQVVRYVRALQSSIGSDFETLYKLAGGKAEATEFIVSDDPRLVNIPFSRLDLKPDILIAAIIRNGKIISPGGQDSMMPGDSVIIISTRKGLQDLQDILK